LFTVCPKCTLTLVVTTVDLRAGQGYVRCGRCANVFNALVALREGDPAALADSDNPPINPPRKPPAEPALGAGVAFDLEPEPDPAPAPAPEPESAAPEIDVSFESPATESEETSLEFDAAATDVSEIFISPSEAEHDTVSGNYEAVVLDAEAQAVAEPDLPPELVAPEPSHTDTIASDEWSLFDDDPPADAESVIEESPLAAEPEAEATEEVELSAEGAATSENERGAEDTAWVAQMFAEAEDDAIRSRTAEHRAFHEDEIPADTTDEPAALRAARDVTGVSASSGDTVLEPLLAPAAPRRPSWQRISGICVLALVLVLQILHQHRQELVLSPAFGRITSKIYGLFNVSLVPRWDLAAYSVKQLGAEAEGAEGSRLRVRLSVQNDSDRVQPLPLVRLTLKDRYNNAVATRDLEPSEYLPARAAGLRLLDPNQRIDADLNVIDPGKAAVGFEIDACLRGENGAVGCANDARSHTTG
jgi:predicted Zn finger-like uncharacterized protein